ncbi:unnamed protein product, partial [Prorocentrum cordatum]
DIRLLQFFRCRQRPKAARSHSLGERRISGMPAAAASSGLLRRPPPITTHQTVVSQGSRRPRASCGPPPAAMSRGAPRHGAVHGGRHAAMSAFASMDLNGDGVVTQEEFCAAQRRMAAQHPGGRPAGGPEWLAAPPAVQAMRGVSRIEVQEKVNAIEAGAALLGQEVEMPNRYAVIDGATHQQVFFAVEQTGFVQRQLKQCFGDCTPWNLDIFYTGRGAPQKA